MSTNKFIKLPVILTSGRTATLYLGAHNFVVNQGEDGVRIIDGVHNNGGWMLNPSETYQKVVDRIDKAMKDAGLL